jgi:hypothetical protein
MEFDISLLETVHVLFETYKDAESKYVYSLKISQCTQGN